MVHLSRLRNGLNVLELWHGVTYAFKDLSLCCTAQFLQYFLEKKEKHVTVVVGEPLGGPDLPASIHRMPVIDVSQGGCVTGSSRAGFITFSWAIGPFDSLREAMETSQNNFFKYTKYVRLYGTKCTGALVSIPGSLGG